MDPAIVAGSSLILFYYFNRQGLFNYGVLVRSLAMQSPLLILLIFPVFKMYRSWRGQPLIKELKIILAAWCTVLLTFNAFILLVANEEQRHILWPFGLFSLKVFWIWAFSCLVTMSLIRIAIRFGFRFLRKLGYNQRTTIIVGAGPVGLNAAANLEKQTWTGINLSGFFDDRLKKGEKIDIGFENSIEVLGSIQDCIPYSLVQKPDMVILALPLKAEEKINKIVWELGTKGISVFLIPDLFAYGLQKANMQQLGDIPIMAFTLFPVWKRIFDLLFSLACLILTSPLFLIVSLLIKLEDGGPAFYRHKRIGESGQIFGCLKFRSMHINSDQYLKELLAADSLLKEEWQRTFKLKNDPRITKIGRFLRKTSLDELPQFINVLLGEMSVVGARPIVSQELSDYYKENAITYCAMKPGITGPWQVGKRNDVEDYMERVDLDSWYVLNASIWLDLKIIFKTILKIFQGSGAY